MLENIEVLYHSSIRISKNKVIYIDPFKIDKNYKSEIQIQFCKNFAQNFSICFCIKYKKYLYLI